MSRLQCQNWNQSSKRPLGLYFYSLSIHIAPFLSSYNILKVDHLIITARAKFIHNLRILKLSAEFDGFVSKADTNDQNFPSYELDSNEGIIDTHVLL